MTNAEGLIAVTGATGQVGGRVAAALAEKATDMRLIVRDPSRAPTYDGVEVEKATYADRAASLAALRGVDVLFMVSAAENEHRRQEHFSFVAAAAEAGVGHIVYTSFFGAAADATFTLARDHFATEEKIKASGMTWTFLRDNIYLDYVPFFAGEEDVLRGPAGGGRLAAVSQDDVAAAAVAVLGDVEGHQQTTYDLTGPDSFTLAEAAGTISRVTGRDVRYVDETIEEAYASRSSYGAPGWQVDAWVSTYTAIAAGELDGVSDHVEQLTGRRPMNLETLLSR